MDSVVNLHVSHAICNDEIFASSWRELHSALKAMAWLEARAAYAGVPLPQREDGSLYGE